MRLRSARLNRHAEKPVTADPAAIGNEKQELHDLVEEVPVVRRTDICYSAFRAHFSVSKHFELCSIYRRMTFDTLSAVPMRIFIIPPALIVSTAALIGQPNRTEGKRNPLQGKPEAEAEGRTRAVVLSSGYSSMRPLTTRISQPLTVVHVTPVAFFNLREF